MNDFAGMEELMRDFLTEANDLLSDVDSKLVELEKSPGDHELLNVIFRGFHTIKGGAGFLNATELVTLCHLTENLFDKLRNGELELNPEIMGTILAATGEVQRMFGPLSQNRQPAAAPAHLIAALRAALDSGHKPTGRVPPAAASALPLLGLGPDWNALYQAITGGKRVPAAAACAPQSAGSDGFSKQVDEDKPNTAAFGRRNADIPIGKAINPRRESDADKGNVLRVDTDRLDQVLTLSGEIGLTRNRLNLLRSNILRGQQDAPTLRALDESVSQLDMLVASLQNAVMKARMQPIGRLFSKYPRLVRDWARQLGKEVELVLSGEETEIDNAMIENLDDPLGHLIRNAVNHGAESPEQREAAGKPARNVIHLGARREGDRVILSITDDGKGMYPEALRDSAIRKGLLTMEAAGNLSDEQSLKLILLPGFSTGEKIPGDSWRGGGMNLVKTNIRKLNGTIGIASIPGKGSEFTISLPFTLVILPVLLLRLGNQTFAVPLSMVREILSITHQELQQISGKATIVVRGEVLPVLPLSALIGWEQPQPPEVGVLMQIGANSFILSVDSFVGHDKVMIKALNTFRPKGVTGATMSSEGEVVLILDIKELLNDLRD